MNVFGLSIFVEKIRDMASINKTDFIAETHSIIEQQQKFISDLKTISADILGHSPGPGQWNALQCIEHMNIAMRIYVDQLTSLNLEPGDENSVKMGWLGRYFVNSMQPKGEKITHKMKTMRKLEPQHQAHTVINEFEDTLKLADQFLYDNKDKVWRKHRLVSALGKWVTFNIAEAYRFILAHNDRHIFQAQRAMNNS